MQGVRNGGMGRRQSDSRVAGFLLAGVERWKAETLVADDNFLKDGT
jgi:hypothetical protein